MRLVLEADEWVTWDDRGTPGGQLCLHLCRVEAAPVLYQGTRWLFVEGNQECGDGLFVGVRALVREAALPDELLPQPDQRWVEM